MEKQEIRKEIKSLCKENADRLAGESERICKRIIESEQYEKAEGLGIYDLKNMPETVNGFDVPVPYLDKEFDLALIGTKGKWYDHKVSVSSPQ